MGFVLRPFLFARRFTCLNAMLYCLTNSKEYFLLSDRELLQFNDNCCLRMLEPDGMGMWFTASHVLDLSTHVPVSAQQVKNLVRRKNAHHALYAMRKTLEI